MSSLIISFCNTATPSFNSFESLSFLIFSGSFCIAEKALKKSKYSSSICSILSLITNKVSAIFPKKFICSVVLLSSFCSISFITCVTSESVSIFLSSLSGFINSLHDKINSGIV